MVKYLPLLLGIIYFITAILGCFGVQCLWLSSLFFITPISAVFMVFTSFVFRCCIWHRLPIYYCLTVDGINFLDYYLAPVTDTWMIFVYLLVTSIFVLIGMYFKNKYNVKRKLNKTSTS